MEVYLAETCEAFKDLRRLLVDYAALLRRLLREMAERDKSSFFRRSEVVEERIEAFDFLDK